MKSISAELAYFFRGRARQNLKVLFYYCAFLLAMVLVYATVFRYLMWQLEGREFSFIAGIYWVITVMTTLGFGDITFHSDQGYIFAALVTITGVVFLLIILPFGMISLFLAPWIEHRLRYHPTLELPADTSGHVLIFGLDPVTRSLVRKLKNRQIPFVLVTPDYQQALRLEEEENLRVVCGSPMDREVLVKVRVEQARHVIANLSDPENANLCLTVRSLAIRSTTCGATAHVLDPTSASSPGPTTMPTSISSMPPEQVLEAGMGLILIGGPQQEELFGQTYLKS